MIDALSYICDLDNRRDRDAIRRTSNIDNGP